MLNMIKLNGFNKVVGGNTAVLDLKIGYTYYDLYFELKDITKEQIKAIRIVSNGQTLEEYRSVAQLEQFNKYKGIKTDKADILHLSFMRPKGGDAGNYENKSMGLREVTAIGTGLAEDPNKINTLEVQLDIDESVTGSPTITTYATVNGASASGLLRKTRHFDYDVQQEGKFSIRKLEPQLGVIDRIFITAFDNDKNTVNIDKVVLKQNDYTVYERTKKLNDFITRERGIFNLLPDYYVIEPAEKGYLNQVLDMSTTSNYSLDLTVSKGCRIRLSIEYLGALPQ